MNRLRFMAVIFLAVVFAVPPRSEPVVAQAPKELAAASIVPAAGTWSGKTNLGNPVSFVVNSIGTSWSSFVIGTTINVSACHQVVNSNVTGPGTIVSGKFSATYSLKPGTLQFTGTFTSAGTASGTYSWINVGGIKNCSQSGTWTAKVPFTKVSPANGLNPWSITPTLSWTANTGATGYLYCIDTVNDSKCNTSWVSVGTHTSVALSGLLQNTAYFWQARSTNGTTFTPANSGTWWTFTTGTLPAPFGKSSPTTGATNQPVRPSLTWNASTGAAGYLYCVDTVNDGVCNTAWVPAGNVTTVAPSFLLPGKTYYWQVRATNATGAVPANGGTWWSFATIPPSVLALPSIGASDGWILESTATSGVGGKTNSTYASFALGDDAANRQYRAILFFRTGTLPPSAIITSATLKFKRLGGTTSNPFATLGNIVADVKIGLFGTSALEPTDFQALPNKYGLLTFTNTPSSGWYSQSLSSANFGYINRAGPTQFRLRFAKDSNNNNTADYWTFYSGDAAAANQPQLVIQYYIP